MIALDVMGGDRAPAATITGAIRWARSTGSKPILVGNLTIIHQLLDHGGEDPAAWTSVSAPVTVGMDAQPVKAIRSLPDASIRRCAELVKSGQAQALVSMGNTGAALAAGVIVVGRATGVERPGLAALLPGGPKPTLLIDVGANVEARPEHLRDFGLMGAIYQQQTFGIVEPRVGILSNGEEITKGNPLVRDAAVLLTESPLAFIGHVEPAVLYGDTADVIVCDGFTGNLVLKSLEATAEFAFDEVRKGVRRHPYTLPGLALLYPALRSVRQSTDYAQYGGVPLLGVNGVVIIGHGRSNAVAVVNALNVAANGIRSNLVNRIAEGLTTIRR